MSIFYSLLFHLKYCLDCVRKLKDTIHSDRNFLLRRVTLMHRRNEIRRLSFIESAGKLFIKQGFGLVTMEAIAAEANASKVTLYKYFPNKEALFEAFVVETGRGSNEELIEAKAEADLYSCLHYLGMTYLNLVTKPEVISVNRLIIGEAGRQPQLSRIFYENGSKHTLISICNVIESLMLRGLLKTAEVRKTGLYFKSLCEAGLVERQLWGLDGPPNLQTKLLAVESAIEIFLIAYLPQGK